VCGWSAIAIAKLSGFLTLTGKNLTTFAIQLLFQTFLLGIRIALFNLIRIIMSIPSNERRASMRGYLCLSLLLGGFSFLTFRYSFLVAFGVMYFFGMLVVIGTAFAVRYRQLKKSRPRVLDDQPVYPESKKLITSKSLHAA
jgi:hypothetical protein